MAGLVSVNLSNKDCEFKCYRKDANKKPGIFFINPCYGHKMFISSNKTTCKIYKEKEG